ncbi:hypothetical protein RZS08_59200, partial [Arthrospira platensis SPKY1]|nr:hypothetical protein [Arthrospira platensis SPKY1]
AEVRQQRNAQPRQGRVAQRFAVVGRQRPANLHRHPLRPLRGLPLQRPGRVFLRPRVVQAGVAGQVLWMPGCALAAQVAAAGHQQ